VTDKRSVALPQVQLQLSLLPRPSGTRTKLPCTGHHPQGYLHVRSGIPTLPWIWNPSRRVGSQSWGEVCETSSCLLTAVQQTVTPSG